MPPIDEEDLRRALTKPGALRATDFILRRHDPRLGKRPVPRIGSVMRDRVCAALTWNVFQTLAMIAPSFWVRRLRARLVGLAEIDHVPLDAVVRLWEPVPAPARADADLPTAAALVETEYEVYGLLTLYGRDLPALPSPALASADIAALVDAVSAHAGVRDCYVGLVTSGAAGSPFAASLIDRLAGRRERLPETLPLPRELPANVRGIGRTTWGDLHAILLDCARASVLDDLERYAAARTAAWLDDIGITPAESRIPSSCATASPG